MPDFDEFEAEMPEDWQGEEYPKEIGACIDLAYQLREERLELTRRVKNMKFREEQLRNHMFAESEKLGLTGAKGQNCTMSIGDVLKPRVTDWEVFYSYIKEHDAFELLERRVAKNAYKERFEQGEEIPGVQGELWSTMSLTKSSRKKGK